MEKRIATAAAVEPGRVYENYGGGRFDERHGPRTRRASLVEAYRRTREGTPADTVGALVDMIGRPDAIRAIAMEARKGGGLK